MQERDVITLSEGLDYLLVSEIEHESEKYFLAMGIDQDNLYIEDHCFFKVLKDEKGEEYLEEVEDEKLLKILYLLITTEASLEEYPELADLILKGDI